ncbi:MAG: hypothetical protein IPQ24_04905 [Anaeromyxobacter sp.]|nr:hypothetical protein [Anaeromyxobacter sp.]
MAHRRAIAPAEVPTGDDLTADLVGMGLLVGGEGSLDPNIEDTLLAASVEGLERDDLRVLAVLVTWFGVHSGHVNADRLTRLAALQESKRVRAFWSALARWRATDRRFARLARAYRGPRLDLLSTGTDFQVARHGEDDRFAGSKLRVPANVLRDRPADVLQPAELARSHAAYRWRLVIGPTYRADMWAALDRQPDLSAAALARATYGSFATAWQVRKEFATWCGAAGS